MTSRCSSPSLCVVWAVSAVTGSLLLGLGVVLALQTGAPFRALDQLPLSEEPRTEPLHAVEHKKHHAPRVYYEPQAPDGELFLPERYALTAITDPKLREQVTLGKRLIEETYALIGPAVEDESMRYAGNELACKNCHLDAGQKPFAAPYVGVVQRFPVFSDRGGKTSSIEDRINGCMERSMNGRKLPQESKEMQAIVSYMTWLSHAAPHDGKVAGSGFVEVDYPERAVDLTHGFEVYSKTCSSCHQSDAQGQKLPSGHGYQFPPLAGPDSYNTGAGMHRVLTAMQFIMGNMPLGATSSHPSLSPSDAFDVAGYINSLPRPAKSNTEKDFPDRKLKPLSTPYPPYADDFTQAEHQFGPFQPIRDFYAEKFGINKTK